VKVAPRIERIWGNFFGRTQVRRKDSADRDNPSSGQQHHEEPKREETRDENASGGDRETVERAISDLRAAGNFTQAGLNVEMLEEAEGLRVRLTQANGALVKVMTADEFLKLKQTSDADKAPRGKILDQKF
jgi:hypothetical protein